MPDWYGETALLKTCRAGHLDVVQWLLTTAKADAGVKTKKGITPLHWLCSFQAADVMEIARMLKNAGADPNAVAVGTHEDSVELDFWFFKGPPLMRAVASGNTVAMRALLDIGAKLTVPLQNGSENLIVFAARRLRGNILSMLLEKAPEYPVPGR
jgi:ankyrin repeat protein